MSYINLISIPYCNAARYCEQLSSSSHFFDYSQSTTRVHNNFKSDLSSRCSCSYHKYCGIHFSPHYQILFRRIRNRGNSFYLACFHLYNHFLYWTSWWYGWWTPYISICGGRVCDRNNRTTQAVDSIKYNEECLWWWHQRYSPKQNH